jgi:uncharacterized Zn-binding protein involved in type VI secretion
MGTGLAAASLGDSIQHSNSMMGFLLGGAVGLAVGLAVVGATVATGGAALAVVAAVGTGLASTGGMALVGEKLGHTFTSHSGKIIAVGSPNVFVNGKPMVVVKRDEGQCSKHGPMPQAIAEGSGSVFANGFPVARADDRLQCGAKISERSPDVFIGGEPVAYLPIAGEVPDWMNQVALGMVYVGGAVALGFGAAAAWAAGGMCALMGFAGRHASARP